MPRVTAGGGTHPDVAARFGGMSEKDKKKEHKQETQAIADQPQEEFISPENIPSRSETEPVNAPARKTDGAADT